MKKLILSLLLATTFKSGYSQQFSAETSNNHMRYAITGKSNTVPAHDYNYYMKRSTAQKTVAWVLAGGGTLVTLIGAIKFSENFYVFSSTESESHESEVGATLVCVGMVLITGSIPLFIASHRNKLKANVAPKSQELSSYLPATANKQVHGLTLTIPLGK